MVGLKHDPHLLAYHVVSEPLVVWVPKALRFGYFWVGYMPLVQLTLWSLALLCLLIILVCVLCFVLFGLLVLHLVLLGSAEHLCVYQRLNVAHCGDINGLVCQRGCALVSYPVHTMNHPLEVQEGARDSIHMTLEVARCWYIV